MPLTHAILSDRRLVTARCQGHLTDAEISHYEQEVWARRDVKGFDEIIDLSAVTTIEPVPAGRIAAIAAHSASMDDPGKPSRVAVIATHDLHFGMARMYQTFRSMNKHSTKTMQIFRTRREALEWLGITDDPFANENISQ